MPASSPAIVTADDLYLGFAFSVLIGQQQVGGFNEVSGLTTEMEVETFREGGFNDAERQLAGAIKYPSRLVLKRGLADSQYLWDWYLGVAQGAIERRDVTIALNIVNERRDGRTPPKWVFHQACPVKWTGPELRAGTSAIAFESIELMHRGLLS